MFDDCISPWEIGRLFIISQSELRAKHGCTSCSVFTAGCDFYISFLGRASLSFGAKTYSEKILLD